jgi:hypothetical protein
MKTFTEFVLEAKKGRCWTGYKPVPGKAPYSDDSCEKIKEHVVKTGSGYKLVSKKTGKNLGTATSKAGIMKREREVEYFKHMHEDGAGACSAGPTNVVGGGAIAGTGGKGGEPGVNPKKKKSPVLMNTLSRKPPKM